MGHEVYFVLESSFSGDLWEFSRGGHVWLIESAKNNDLARAVWTRETEDYTPYRGVTTFRGSEDSIDTFYSLLGTIADHHSEYSAPEPWDSIHVMGVPRDRVASNHIADELGLEAVVLAAEGKGFVIRRAAHQGEPSDGASHSR